MVPLLFYSKLFHLIQSLFSCDILHMYGENMLRVSHLIYLNDHHFARTGGKLNILSLSGSWFFSF